MREADHASLVVVCAAAIAATTAAACEVRFLFVACSLQRSVLSRRRQCGEVWRQVGQPISSTSACLFSECVRDLCCSNWLVLLHVAGT